MKKIIILLILISAGINGFSQRNKKKTPPAPPAFALNTAEDSLAYAIGVLNFQSLDQELIKRYDLNIQLEVLTKAMTDLSKDTALINPEQANEFLGIYMTKKEQQLAENEKLAGKKFLIDNLNKPGINVTPSGLQYEVIEMGTGNKPLATDKVTVHYTGTLIDGTVFDSSVERGEPATFPLNQVIPGWTEGIQLMPAGSKFKLFIPSELAYGENAQGPIKPNSALIFEIDFLSIDNSQ